MISSYILVTDSKPKLFDTAIEAVQAFTAFIEKCVHSYSYKGSKDPQVLIKELDDTNKLSWYAYSQYDSPVAIALYKTNDDYVAADWYNTAAAEEPENREIILAIEAGILEFNQDKIASKTMEVGDIVRLDDGSLGRIDVMSKDSFQVSFQDFNTLSYYIGNRGGCGRRSGLMGHNYKLPTQYEIRIGKPKLAAYWFNGKGWAGQGKKAIDLFMPTVVWDVYKLEEV